jgi:lysyl-tRNA synthetase class I
MEMTEEIIERIGTYTATIVRCKSCGELTYTEMEATPFYDEENDVQWDVTYKTPCTCGHNHEHVVLMDPHHEMHYEL